MLTLTKWPFIIYVIGHKLPVLPMFHIVLLINIFIPTLFFTSTLTLYDYSNTSILSYPTLMSRSGYLSDIILDNFYIVNSSSTVYNSGYINLIKSFYWFGTNPTNQYFLMDSSTSISIQSVLSHTYHYPFKLSVLDLSPFIIDLITLINLITVYIYTLRKKIITF